MAPTRQKGATPPNPLANGHDAGEIDTTTGNDAEIEVVGDEAAKSGGDTQTDPGIEELRQQLATERANREAAERERDRLAQINNGAAKEIVDNRLLVITSNIEANVAKKTDIMRRIVEAKEAGDYTAETNAQAELSEVTLDLKQARLGKSRLEMEIEDAKNGGGQQQRSGDDAGDRLEDYFRANNVHPRAQNWLRSHRDYAQDPAKNARLSVAHYDALAGGAALNSDDYFRIIEEKLGMRQPEANVDTGEQQRESSEQQRSSTPPSAPVTRSGGIGGGGRQVAEGITELAPGKYRVTPAIQDAAAMSGITVAKYIEEALKLTRGSDGQLH
jgi:hypothetical protein